MKVNDISFLDTVKVLPHTSLAHPMIPSIETPPAGTRKNQIDVSMSTVAVILSRR